MAVVAGAIIIGIWAYAVVDSIFWFVPRYEAGGLRHRFFTDLAYATNGWLGVAFFGGCGAFFLPHWLAALRRVATTEPALQIGDDSLTLHPSFRQKLRSIPFSQVKNLLVTTEGEAMSSSSKALSSMSPLGSGWLVKKAAKKSCLLITYSHEDGKNKRIKVSAQFIDGGADSLVDFEKAFNLANSAV